MSKGRDLFPTADRARAERIARIANGNPFLPERIENEREVLGAAFVERDADWNRRTTYDGTPPNVARLHALAEEILARVRDRRDPAEAGGKVSGDEELFQDLAWFCLYQRHREGFDRTVSEAIAGREPPPLTPLYDAFRAEAGEVLGADWCRRHETDLAHVFALFFQVRRAFANIFQWIVGVSEPAVRLRAQVWESIFTHDLRRYRSVLYDRMADFTTLVVGPSGTGKELVARAVGLSRYVPFDPKTRTFRFDFAGSFQSLNLSALSPTLIESELFGHKRGAFTGAVSDRTGWLEACPPYGSVFLDEIGELDLAIQVKLLRVLESRTFSRLGETKVRRFPGKIIAATNRDLDAEMRAGRFREDLYYRLCSDIVETPSLAARLQDADEELAQMVRFLATRLVGDEGATLAGEVIAWIEAELGNGYAWPGNVRELEQCVRNVLLRREYRPRGAAHATGGEEPVDRLLDGARDGSLSAEELLRRYCTHVYRLVGTYEGAARRLGLDRRTVKAKVQAE